MLNMTEQNPHKLKQLERDLPEGLIVDAGWLERRGYASNLRSYYVKHQWLEQPARGAYRRTRGKPGWQQVAISLQTLLDYPPLIVGGGTALTLHGFSHYLSQDLKEIHLYGEKAPPSWVDNLKLEQRFIFHNQSRLFENETVDMEQGNLPQNVQENQGRDLTKSHGGSVTSIEWGQWNWHLALSTPERAILELLDELPDRTSFHHVDKIMEGLAGLRPRKMQKLLLDCRSIKVKRLFFFFADRHQHAWLKHLDKKSIPLGTGKRLLAKGGKLDPVYHITVPNNLDHDH
ncbi:MAG: type IV toxin-antitoxin system AbiEi family antitoxin domain-containing protein [Luteolibacter sp.]